jgi:hypothetical protein
MNHVCSQSATEMFDESVAYLGGLFDDLDGSIIPSTA